MTTEQDSTSAFIARWQGITASELSTSQSFVIELCELLGVARPHATAEQDYMFERPVTFQHGDGSSSAGRIDCYRRGAFIWESKKLKPAGTAAAKLAAARQAWPAALPEQMRAVADVLAASARALDEAALAEGFSGRGPWKKRLPQILQTLDALGRARREGERWRA